MGGKHWFQFEVGGKEWLSLTYFLLDLNVMLLVYPSVYIVLNVAIIATSTTYCTRLNPSLAQISRQYDIKPRFVCIGAWTRWPTFFRHFQMHIILEWLLLCLRLQAPYVRHYVFGLFFALSFIEVCHPIDNRSALVQVIACCQTLPEPMLTKITHTLLQH